MHELMRRSRPALSIFAATLFACAPAARIDPILDGSSPVSDSSDPRDASAATDASAREIDGASSDASATDSALEAASVVADAQREGTDAATPRDASVDSNVDASVDAAVDAGGPTVRVLFIGNSYTYVNDLPAILVRIGETAGRPPRFAVDSITPGGSTLQYHWESSGAQPRLAEARWDFVSLQGQSVEPVLAPASFAAYADRFGALASMARAQPLWFATWARRADSPVYAEPWSGGSFAAMTAGLERAYAMAHTRNGGALVRVGAAWERSLAMHPTITLHDADGSHPTLAGSYLAACVFYRSIVGADVPELAEVPAGLSAEDARALRRMAAAP
jgi:hypothetical protein